MHIRLIVDELNRRKSRNPRYSLRAFALWAKIDASSLSRMLNGKQPFSMDACTKLLRGLALSEEQREAFVMSVAEERKLRMQTALRKVIQQSQTLPGELALHGPLTRSQPDHGSAHV